MKQLGIIIFIMSAVFAACSETYVVKTDKGNDNLKGDVKFVMSVDFKAVDKFDEGVITKGEPCPFGTEYIEYDTLGFYKEIKRFHLSNIKTNGTRFYVNEGNYRRYEYRDNNNKLSSGEERIYDDKGTLIETKDLTNGKVSKYQTKYDSEGNLVYYKTYYTTYQHKYENGKIIQTISPDPFGRVVTYDYEYDTNGNRVKEIRSSKDWDKKSYFFTKYDLFNREVDFYHSYVDNPSVNDITYRFKYYYENDSVKEEYLRKYWGEGSDIPSETISIWLTNSNDTTCLLELDENFEIKKIKNISKDSNKEIEREYWCDSEISSHTIYHYTNNKLTSKMNNDGYEALYKYNNKGELYEVVENYGGESKYVTAYINNRPQSRIRNNGEDKKVFEYKKDEDVEILTEIWLEGEKEKLREIIFYENGKKIKYIDAESTSIEYLYNDNGDLICMKDDKGNETNYSYEYDKIGNWIKRTIYENGQPQLISERKIFYY